MSEEDENDNEKLTLVYKSIRRIINVPETFNDLRNAFLEAFEENKNKDFEFYKLDEDNYEDLFREIDSKEDFKELLNEVLNKEKNKFIYVRELDFVEQNNIIDEEDEEEEENNQTPTPKRKSGFVWIRRSRTPRTAPPKRRYWPRGSPTRW